jgi:N-acetylmuramoyl-L-alanine amidase
MRSIYIILLICVSFGAQAAPVKVENTRIWAAPDSTRVVFDISAPVENNISMLTSPYRAVIDLENTLLMGETAQPVISDKFLQGVRIAKRNKQDLRIVLDLKKFVSYKSFLLQPNKHYGHRLVVDLFNSDGKELSKVKLDEQEEPSNRPRDVIIAVDAGHGGEDPGARGPSGVFEKDVVFKIAQKLVHLINQEHGMRAVMVREGDYFLRLRKRIAIAREHKADLFISIHADAFKDSRVRGSSVYVLSRRGASSEAARWLAESENASDLIGGVSLDDKDDILASVLLDLSQTASLEASIDVADRLLQGLKGLGKVHKRSVQSAGFAVLKSPDIPSILIETAYISNPTEEKNLTNPTFQGKMAGAILSGLRGYFRDFAPEDTLLAKRKHTISRGETLSTIAQHYRISTESLREYNGLKGDLVRAGQVLSIPVGSGT